MARVHQARKKEWWEIEVKRNWEVDLIEMEGSGERDELVWERESSLSLHPSIHPSHTLTLCQGSWTDVSGQNKHEGLYVTETHTHKHKSKQTNQKDFSWCRNRKWMEKLFIMRKDWNIDAKLQRTTGEQTHLQHPCFRVKELESSLSLSLWDDEWGFT